MLFSTDKQGQNPNLESLEEELVDIVSTALDTEGDHFTAAFSLGLGCVVVGMEGRPEYMLHLCW